MNLSSLFDPGLYRKESAKTFVVITLKEAIRKGILPGGTPLRQGAIAGQLKVSHIPVREALRQLESEGLVTVLPHRGASVATLSPSEARDIFHIRLFLETGALKLAFANLTELDLLRARKTLEMADQEEDPDRWSELNWDFHFTLYGPSGNFRLLRLIEDMHINVNRYLRIYLALMNFQQDSQEEHHRLLRACAEKNLEEALGILEAHLSNASSHLVKFLETEA